MTLHYNHPPMQDGWIDRPHQLLALGDFRLRNGGAIRDFVLSYVVHGEINADRSNVVLCATPISSIHHKYDFLIGPGRALDTDRYCVIVVDAIGNGLTTSPSTSAAQPGEAFPRFTIADMVESQRALVDHLEIDRLHAVLGASMGGMQVLQWAVAHPQRLARAVAMVPMARTTAWSVCVNEASRRALMADPEWQTGSPTRGWHAWTAIMQVLAARTPDAMAAECATAADAVGAIERRVVARAATNFQPWDWIYQTWAYDTHDVSLSGGFNGDLAAALGAVKARMLIVSAPGDLYNPTSAALAAADMIPRAQYVEIPSILGHHATNGVDADDTAFLSKHISDFLLA
jgi:homoserine O-acetyltransferase/O-succinyltransferase